MVLMNMGACLKNFKKRVKSCSRIALPTEILPNVLGFGVARTD